MISGSSSSALEATRSHFTRSEATSGRLRSHLRPPGAAGWLPRVSRSRREGFRRGSQAREHPRKLDKIEVGATWASRASGASRWLLPEPLEHRDSCSQSLWILEMAVPRASGASTWLLPEPLEPRHGCPEIRRAWRLGTQEGTQLPQVPKVAKTSNEN